MGDRAIVHFVTGTEISPATYLHWGGYKVGGLLAKTRELMKHREEDVAYTSARFTGICHQATDGNLSLGVWNAPRAEYAEALATIRTKDYSHGDAGVFIVHLPQWEVETQGGYGFKAGDKEDRHGLPTFTPPA